MTQKIAMSMRQISSYKMMPDMSHSLRHIPHEITPLTNRYTGWICAECYMSIVQTADGWSHKKFGAA